MLLLLYIPFLLAFVMFFRKCFVRSTSSKIYSFGYGGSVALLLLIICVVYLNNSYSYIDGYSIPTVVNMIKGNSGFWSIKHHVRLFLFFKFSGFLFNVELLFGLDGLSMVFILLTGFLIFIIFLISFQSLIFQKNIFMGLIFFIEFLLIGAFLSVDIFLFYIFFESVLIPMFLLIGIWGSNLRRVNASFYFFLYTLAGSLLFLVGIILIYNQCKTTNLVYLYSYYYSFSKTDQIIYCLLFFFGFAIKIPMLPYHLWLPEAHVEAPTNGSVILAGLLLKLGGYGFIRFFLFLFPYGAYYWSPIIQTLAICGTIYASFTTLRQIDLKRIIAYSSIAHMNYVVLGIFSFNFIGLSGSIFLMIGHGFVSSALFLLIGILYERYHSRIIFYYTGLNVVMPYFSMFFLFFSLCNLAFPGTINFFGEFFILLGLVKYSFFLSIASLLGMFLCTCYSIWLYNRLMTGDLLLKYGVNFRDLDEQEIIVFGYLTSFCLLFGLKPDWLMECYHSLLRYFCSIAFEKYLYTILV